MVTAPKLMASETEHYWHWFDRSIHGFHFIFNEKYVYETRYL